MAEQLLIRAVPWSLVAGPVFAKMTFWEFQAYMRARCSVDRDLAVRLGQQVIGVPR